MKSIINRQNIWSVVVLSIVLTSLIIEQPFLKFHFELIAIGVATILAVSYKYNWLDYAKVLFGITISYGSILFGYIFYMLLPNESVEQSKLHNEPPPQRFDIIIFGSLFALLFLVLTLLYYYRFRKNDTTILEKYFSYALLVGLTMTTAISLFFSF